MMPIRVIAASALLALVSCTSSLVSYEARVHVVQPGETLHTIAWRHNLDHRDLAQWNRLSNPDLIYVGQRLELSPGVGAERPTASAPTRRAPQALPPPPDLPAPPWQWPTEGSVVSPFGSADGVGRGIGIGGTEGQAVRAAASGRVVYAGSGLIGYGPLVIVKHNDTYLSAYGHNRALLVSQGDDVEQGQVIAQMGLGPGRAPRLHFEIRRNGVPLDPVSLLGPAP